MIPTRSAARRDPAVDVLRLVALGVVVLWHWVFSLNHRAGGVLVNPNPIDDIPGGWLLTWLFQVMPLFFVIGGYANLSAWEAVGRTAGTFLARRLLRLLGPVAVFGAVWFVGEILIHLLRQGYPGALAAAPVVFAPLWFVAAYVWTTALVPLTARLHRRWGVAVVVGLGALVVAADLARFGYGADWAGLVNTVLVWVFAHQLGYLWRDGTLTPAWRGAVLTAAALGVMALAVALTPYPRSLVAVPSQELSHMLPTTAVIAALAVFWCGVAGLLSPALRRWSGSRWSGGRWSGGRWPLRRANRLVYPVFLWHMTALLLVFLAVEQLGYAPGGAPTPGWWQARPFWLVAPAVVLAGLLVVFAPVERHFARLGSPHRR
ncbi:MAG: acyltransferase family protein [Micromonosporaceae bacterium]